MALIPGVLIDKINDYIVDLYLIEHKQNLRNTLKKIESIEKIENKYHTSWSTLSDGTLDNRFMIFCTTGIITYAMIDIYKIGNICKLKDSWIYKNNTWNFSKKEYLR